MSASLYYIQLARATNVFGGVVANDDLPPVSSSRSKRDRNQMLFVDNHEVIRCTDCVGCDYCAGADAEVADDAAADEHDMNTRYPV